MKQREENRKGKCKTKCGINLKNYPWLTNNESFLKLSTRKEMTTASIMNH